SRGGLASATGNGGAVGAPAGDAGSASGGNPTPYPADYDDVIGVGAIQQTGELWPNSQTGSYVDLVAPGAAVVTLQRGQGMAEVDGTGVACGFVAATAALVRSRRGTPTPDQVARQLNGTAIPAAGGPRFGHGIVNPYAAVVERLADRGPVDLPALTRSSTERSPAWERSRDLALIGGGVAVLAVLIVLVVAVSLPRGRRRFWRSSVAPVPVTREEPEEPAPPLQLFTQ
ncbi:S8 family serine peptidase, partial [Micromonospora sp. CPCC 205371]|nr:S8 family serine peptidase [Micromonospora sp. CPCC 205371]